MFTIKKSFQKSKLLGTLGLWISLILYISFVKLGWGSKRDVDTANEGDNANTTDDDSIADYIKYPFPFDIFDPRNWDAQQDGALVRNVFPKIFAKSSCSDSVIETIRNYRPPKY